MLLLLSVNNYALIDNISLEFQAGFTTITGETGAGKSIILGALGLLLGNRADGKNLDDKKCIVEGHFDLSKYELKWFFDNYDIDYEQVTILRRELIPSGKSRAFINDTPVKLDVLKKLSDHLIDIHSQNQNLLIENSGFQLGIVDSFCKHQNLIEDYKKVFNAFEKLKKQLGEMETKAKALIAEDDYNRFILGELDEANPQIGEIQEIEGRLTKQENIEEIKSILFKINGAMDGYDSSILNSLRESVVSLTKIEHLSEKYSEFRKRLNQAYEEIKDLQPEIEYEAENLDFDPKEIVELNDRMNLLRGFLHKFQLNDEKELIDFRESIRRKIDGAGVLDNEIGQLRRKLKEKEEEMLTLGKNITKNRVKSFPKIESKLGQLTKILGIKYGEVKIRLNPFNEPRNIGLESVSFLFRANKGSSFGEIGSVASGGELARIMFGIKYIVSGITNLPTIIFDEIDTGISGDIADKMAKMMQEMGENMQVISITHLPQIASKGLNQFLVYKKELGGKSTTLIKKLNVEERVREIAKMLSGDHVSKAALENAKVLLKQI